MQGVVVDNDYLRAWSDWCFNLTSRPEQQWALVQGALARGIETWQYALRAAWHQNLSHGNDDVRFANALWNTWPYNL